MIDINFRDVNLTVDYETTPADESVGLKERLYIIAIYYKGVDVLELVDIFETGADIRDLEDEIWEEIERYGS